MKYQTFKQQAAQGDLLISRIDELPEGLTHDTANPDNVQKNKYIVTHSETGHNHVMSVESAEFYTDPKDEFKLYVVVNEPTVLEHHRSFDTHKPIKVDAGNYRINRQREYIPEGFRRAAD